MSEAKLDVPFVIASASEAIQTKMLEKSDIVWIAAVTMFPQNDTEKGSPL